MVAIAQLVEHWIVIPVVAGSIPVGHPTLMNEFKNLNRSQERELPQPIKLTLKARVYALSLKARAPKIVRNQASKKTVRETTSNLPDFTPHRISGRLA